MLLLSSRRVPRNYSICKKIMLSIIYTVVFSISASCGADVVFNRRSRFPRKRTDYLPATCVSHFLRLAVKTGCTKVKDGRAVDGGVNDVSAKPASLANDKPA